MRYRAIQTGSGRSAALHPEFRNVNTVLANLKTAICGTYHAFKFAKYADRHLAEVQYRFNRRFDLSVILRRLLRAATTPPYPAPVRTGRLRFIALKMIYRSQHWRGGGPSSGLRKP